MLYVSMRKMVRKSMRKCVRKCMLTCMRIRGWSSVSVPEPLGRLNIILCLQGGAGLEAAVCMCVCQNSVRLLKPICAAEGGARGVLLFQNP